MTAGRHPALRIVFDAHGQRRLSPTSVTSDARLASLIEKPITGRQTMRTPPAHSLIAAQRSIRGQ
jgi:hypothetical protein